MGIRGHNFRHLQHSCSSLEEVLLIFLEDIARNNPFIVLSTFLKYVLLAYSYRSKAMASEQVALSSSENMRASCQKS